MTAPDDNKMIALKEYIREMSQKDYPDSYLIAVLHKAQELYGYLSQEVMDEVSLEMKIPTAHIWGVATFYHYFNLTPPGEHKVSVCLGTACYVKGAGQIMTALKNELKCEEGEVSPDGLFQLEGARCLGACGLAPVVMIDDKIHGDLTPEKTVNIIKKMRKDAQQTQQA